MLRDLAVVRQSTALISVNLLSPGTNCRKVF
jgi:hypothetical protein